MNNFSKENSPIYREFEKEALPHMDSLYNFAFKMTGNSDDADDLVQETYLKAFKFFDKFEKGTNCKAWLFRIMKNSFINDYRRNSKTPNKVDYDDVQNFYETIKASEVKTEHLEEDVYSKLIDDDISNALNSMHEDFRTVIILSDVEGFTYEEISEFIDSPVGTVRSRLHRARKMLYSKLFNYAKEKGFIKSVEKQLVNENQK